MVYRPVKLEEAFLKFEDVWAPKTAAKINDYAIKLVKVEGEFVWHHHEETDELFLVWRGRLRIDLPNASVDLGEGDLFVVPRGIEHRPIAEPAAEIVLLEPAATVNTGQLRSDRTALDEGV